MPATEASSRASPCLQVLAHARLGRLHLGQGGIHRRAGRHVDVHVEDAQRVEGEELHADDAGSERGDSQGEHGCRHAQPQFRPAHGPNQQARVLDAQGVGEIGAPALHARGVVEVQPQHADDMGRQHPVGLDQADGQRQGDDEGDDEHELADDARQQHQRQEGRDGGRHRRGHRRDHLAQGVDRRGEMVLAALDAIVDGLDHHHGVVDQHAQGDDDAEQHRDVEGVAQRVQHAEGAGQREGNAEADQQRDARTEEQPADAENDQQAEHGVGLHDADGLTRHHRLVVHQHRRDAGLGQRLILLGDVAVDLLHQLDGVHLALLGHREHHRRAAVRRRRGGPA
jgi:hypothetical protein